MNYTVSDRIWGEKDVPLVHIEKVDAFLARPAVRRFTLGQVLSITGLKQYVGGCDEASPILQRYVEHGILKEELKYTCPECGTEIDVDDEGEGQCYVDGDFYNIQECKAVVVYTKLAEPDNLPKTIEEIEAHWLEAGLIKSYQTAAQDLENGNDAAIEEAIELLRVAALREQRVTEIVEDIVKLVRRG